MRVDPPRRRGPYPARWIDCQQALDHALQDLMEEARAAGWLPGEIEDAIGQLAVAAARARDETAALEAELMLIMAFRNR